MRWFEWLKRLVKLMIVVGVAVVLLSSSVVPPGDFTERVRAYTRPIEFDYVDWTLDALALKWGQAALSTQNYLSSEPRRQMVLEYLRLVQQIQQMEGQLNLIYADPNISNPESASADLRAELARLRARRDQIQPVAEAVLQSQIGDVVAEMGLAVGGQPVPPVLYHSTPLPLALIVSPRTVIRQDADVSLQPYLSVDERAALEDQVDQGLDVSSLVVNIGGVGVYPTMVQETGDLNWLSEVVAHEWVHNFLTLRPLGMNYMTSPALRTMNETTASIAGKEIGLEVLKRFYPELVPPPPAEPAQGAETTPAEPQAPEFNFYDEMRVTRVHVDELLEQGKVDEAEAYMEARRVIFWEHGYRGLRKLNQAYFAFHGAYADQPGGGAAGADPVGAAVRQLRAQSDSLSDFLRTIAWITSFEQLQQVVGEPSL